MKINISEKNGISVDGKEILLGDSIQLVKNIFGTYDVFENNYYVMEGTLLFSVDGSLMIREIEVRCPEDDSLVVMFQTLDIFNEEKDLVLDYMSTANGALLSNEGCMYKANNLGIVFSFGMSEEDVADLVRESKKDSMFEEMRDEIERDIYRSKHVESFLICG